jgi:PPOX class probable F420-dependent enzyme
MRGAKMSQTAMEMESGILRFVRKDVPIWPGKYLSITSFRRDGTAVATPVWFVQEGSRLLVKTDSNSYKVRRIRHTPFVKVAPCTASGRLHSEPVDARAELLPEDELNRVEELFSRKYRVDKVLILPVYRLMQHAMHPRRQKQEEQPVVLAITPV